VSNLSDLLPAGASGKTIEAVATAIISSKAPVILETAGTVTQVGETTVSPSMPLGSTSTWETQAPQFIMMAADSLNSNRWVIVWRDDVGTPYVYVRIITRSGTTLTMSPISTVYANGGIGGTGVVWDKSTADRFLVIYNNNTGSYGDASAVVCNVTGSVGSESFTYGTPLNAFTTDALTEMTFAGSVVIDLGSGNFFVIWSNEANDYPTGRVLQISSTDTVTAGGSDTVINSNILDADCCNAVVNSTDGSTILVGTMRPTPYISDVGISGTTITTNSTAQIAALTAWDSSAIWILDIDQERFVTAFEDANNNYVYCYVGTLSGGSFSFGSRYAMNNFNTRTYCISNNTTFPDTFAGVSCAFNGKPYGVAGTVTGTTISFNTPTVIDSTNDADQFLALAQQSDNGGHFMTAYAPAPLLAGFATIGKTGGTFSNLTATNFVGIADAAISSAATGTVVVQGGTATGLSSLTTGSKYYVQGDGTITTVSSSVNAGLAISTTSLLLNGDS
jgi:hypothetical protein